MPFIPVILWTDRLVFLLVAVMIVSAWYIRRHEHLRAPWGKVARSRYGMCSLVVLSVFVVIGLLDSMHYRPRLEGKTPEGKINYAVEVRSVFDALVAPLGRRLEKTYWRRSPPTPFPRKPSSGPTERRRASFHGSNSAART